jgi:predicted membrane metal-binding protein
MWMNAVMVSLSCFTVITLVMIAATLLSSSSYELWGNTANVLFIACAVLIFDVISVWVVWKIYHNRDR